MGVVVKAPAKLNITLDILGKRADGYHLLDMIVQTVDLCDIAEIELNDTGEITLSESSGTLPCGEDNLAYAAAKLVLGAAGSSKGAHIKLWKNIPVAAGLGGGSSDAAAVMKGIDQLLGYPFTSEQLAEMSVPLGADVPMCVIGGCMRARGIGEQIERLPQMPPCYILISKNGQKPSTGEMYRRVGSVGITKRPATELVAKGIAEGNLSDICRGIYNVFIPACDEVPIEDMELLRSTAAYGVGLSGSGPSVFGIYENEADAIAAAEKLKMAGKTAYICRPCE